MPLKLILSSKKAILIFTNITAMLLVILLSSCQQDPDVLNGENDSIELESVWQYLKAFSIYQDSSLYEGRILENPFEYSSPEQMFERVADTLKHREYTKYDSNLNGYVAAYEKVVGLPSVYFNMVADSTGIIVISSFLGNDIYNQFLRCINKIPSSCKNLIIDLRGNTGGSIPEVDSIIEAFLPPGKEYIEARERNLKYGSEAATIEWHPWYTGRPAHPALAKKKIIVWMDSWTASASEILAVALKDCASATLVGSRSYGKGIGQIILPRSNRQWLQITFLQLRGISKRTGYYHGTGLTPDIETNDLTEIIRLVEPSYQGKSKNYASAVYKNSVPACYKIIYGDSITGY